MRLIHAAMITGIVLFALVAHFVMRPNMTTPNDTWSAAMVRTFLGASL